MGKPNEYRARVKGRLDYLLLNSSIGMAISGVLCVLRDTGEACESGAASVPPTISVLARRGPAPAMALVGVDASETNASV